VEFFLLIAEACSFSEIRSSKGRILKNLICKEETYNWIASNAFSRRDFFPVAEMQNIKIYLTLGFIYMFSTIALGQFNDTTNYYINFGSSGILNKTNERSSWIVNNNLRFSLYKKQTALNSSTSFVYGEQQRILSNRDFTSSLDFNYYLKNQPTYFWGLGSFEKNFSLRIDGRIQTGLGIGYMIVETNAATINLSDGILYERSQLNPSQEVQTAEYETARNSFRLKFHFIIAERLTLDGTHFLQHALSDRNDYIVRSQTSLSFKLLSWLSFTSGVTYNKMSVTRRENFIATFGLTAQRYF
jgi:hypothetical protein